MPVGPWVATGRLFAHPWTVPYPFFNAWQEDIEAEFQEWDQAVEDLLEMTSVASHKRCPNITKKWNDKPKACAFCEEHFGDPFAVFHKSLIVNGEPSAKRG